jgi:hypothetical protein
MAGAAQISAQAQGEEAVTVDTLEIARELEAAGMDKRQAEAVTKVLGRVAHDELVTRDYLDMKIATLKAELFKIIVGQGIAVAGIVIAASKLLK